MRFRPCIDIHNGKVKQIVGGSLKDQGDQAAENFVAEQDAAWYAALYQEKKLSGGHVILLNPESSPYYEATKAQAMKALAVWPGGLQIGGGIHDKNAEAFLKAGASHVIVTSFVFKDGRLKEENLERLVHAVGKEHLVLDLSCRKKEDAYYIVTDRWQKFTRERVRPELLDELAQYCDEFLVHAADVEGKTSGIERELVKLLGKWGKIPVTYAGGISEYDDIADIRELSDGKLNVTIGSALDLFGGPLNYETVLSYIHDV